MGPSSSYARTGARSASRNGTSGEDPKLSSLPFRKQPPEPQTIARISFPTPEILLVVLDRPRDLNCMDTRSHWELHELFEWFDEEPSLRVAVVTGMGRAFCAGADLKEWNGRNSVNTTESTRRKSGEGGSGANEQNRDDMPPSGFGALSRRSGKKPVIGAINGLAYGGGMEICVNLDMVFAAKSATFALPEVKRGVVAVAGALPRLVRTVGRQRAMEMALTGRVVGAGEAHSWGLVNAMVEDAAADADVMDRPVVNAAMECAGLVAANSPDSVIVSREGVKMGWEGVGAEEGARLLSDGWMKRLYQGDNFKEGLRAFVEKRRPEWIASKL